MRPAQTSRPVTCPYGKKGSSWATGEHGGIDYGTPTGDPVYAMWGGTVTAASWGSAYGTQLVIDHDTLPDGSPGLWAVYAHLSSKQASAGARVQAGQLIGYSGATGNVSGPHLHVEVQKAATWRQGYYTNPQKWIDAQEVTVDHGPVYLSKLAYGQDDSDSVKRLQLHLNAHPLTGGSTLPVTGNYGEQTDAEVRLCQAQHGYGNDPEKGSSVGPEQAAHLISGCSCTIIDDVTVPDPGPEPPTGELTIDGFGLWQWYSGKPAGEFTLHPDGEWHRLGFTEPASGITAENTEFRFLYLRVELPKGRTADRVLETKFVRAGGDATAYDSEEYGLKRDSVPYYNIHLEAGDGRGGQWWVKVSGGSDPIKLTTRYAKQHTHYLDLHELARALGEVS